MAAEILDHGTRVLTGPGAGVRQRRAAAGAVRAPARWRGGARLVQRLRHCGAVLARRRPPRPLRGRGAGRRGVGAVRAGRSRKRARRRAHHAGLRRPARLLPGGAGARAGSTLRPATRRISAAARPARTPAAPPPAMKGPARWMTWPPARRGRCGLAGGLRCATARRTSRASARRCARRGWNPSGLPLCAAARTPRRGCFCWKRAAAGAPGLCWNRTSC